MRSDGRWSFTETAFGPTRMPDDEHYFGLGDKVGPLDRRNQAFTLWNSDIYSFQESTDPSTRASRFS